MSLVLCHITIRMHDGSTGQHSQYYPSSAAAMDKAMELFGDKAQVISCMVDRSKRIERGCDQIGVCQGLDYPCPGCVPQGGIQLAPGVIEGPYRKPNRARDIWRDLRDWLMGEHP